MTDIFLQIFFVVGGILLLIKGADWLVFGTSGIAKRLGVSELMIGLTVVSFGTSAPELIVNILAVMRGNTDIAIGNIVGSNIANILLILGISAAIRPIAVQRSTVLKEIPFAILAATLLLIMAYDSAIDGAPVSELSRSDGLAFVAFFIIFLFYTFGLKREENDESAVPGISLAKAIPLTLVGLLALAIGGELTVRGAQALAVMAGISQALIAVTVIAVGTSLPELMTSVVAAMKGKSDIAIGNIVGSNIFNIFWILGISAIIRPLPFRPAFVFDLSWTIGAAVLLFIVIHNGAPHRRLLLWWKQVQDYSIRRWEAWILLASYAGYLSFVVWRG